MGLRNREYAEIVKLLKHKKFQLQRSGSGSHEYRYNPETKRGTIVIKPHWWDRVSVPWTFLWMLEKAWISKEDAIAFKEGKCK